MSEKPSVGAFAVVPCNDLEASIPFWKQLGFEVVGGNDQYRLVKGWECEVHLTQAGEEPWRVREESNPFGVYIRTPNVEEIAKRAREFIIRPGGVLRHREWGLFEVGISAPDGMLLRVGWPSELMNVGCHSGEA